MIGDPLREVLDASERAADDADVTSVDGDDLARVRLARRRFGVALPPPFVAVPARPAELPIRPGGPSDGPAVAAVQRRSWRAHHRGLLSDAFLDRLDLGYLGRYWTGRCAVAPSPRHRLFVAGRPGEVHGAIDTGPTRDLDSAGDAGPDTDVGEVRSLYLDPTVVGSGLGAALLERGVEQLRSSGFRSATLWVVEGNHPARRFYERHGWELDGATMTVPVDDEVLHDVRYRLRGGL